MGAKSHPPSQPSSAASVHCMHIRIFNKVYYLLQVLYSENGLTWKYVKVGLEVKLFEGNPLYNHAIAHSFDPPLRVRGRNKVLTVTYNHFTITGVRGTMQNFLEDDES